MNYDGTRFGCFLSLDDFFLMQDIFLVPGTHRLRVASWRTGRELVMNGIQLFRRERVACLTSDQASLPDHVGRLYDALAGSGAFFDQYRLELFLLEQMAYDFVWVEGFSSLITQPWFFRFESSIQRLSLEGQPPVLFMEYPG